MSSKIVILGGGYAGVSAARRLARSSENLDVALVNPRSEFVERIRLHQYVAGNHSAVADLRSLVPQTTKLLIDAAAQIDAGQQRVHLSGNGTLDYDHLIYAVGSHDRTGGITGSSEHAYSLGTYEAAQATRARLAALPGRASISVIGGGLTGVETAAELAGMDSGHTVHLVTDAEVAPSVGGRARQYIRKYLSAGGVVLVENAPVQQVSANELLLVSGATIPSDLTILTTGSSQPDTARDSGLHTSSTGALIAGPTLASAEYSNIVGAGDSALVPGSPMRMSCQAAIPSGVHAAETVLRMIDGRNPKPVRPKFTGQAISLGRTSGVLQTAKLNDEPRRHLALTGRTASYIKEQVCANTLHFGHFGRFSYSWS